MTGQNERRNSRLDGIEDGAVPEVILDRIVGGRGTDTRREITAETAAALTAAEPVKDAQKDAVQEPGKVEKPFKSESSKTVGPLDITKTTKDGWDEKKAAWVKSKDTEISFKTNDESKKDDSQWKKAFKDGAKDAASKLPEKLRDGYHSLAQSNAEKSGNSAREEAIDKVRGKAGVEAPEAGKIIVKVTEKDGSSSEKSITTGGKPVQPGDIVGAWDPLKAGSKGPADSVTREAHATYKVDNSESLSNETGSLKVTEKIKGDVKDIRIGGGAEGIVGGIKVSQSHQAGASTLTETTSKSIEAKTSDTTARETEAGARAAAQAELGSTSKIGAIETNSKLSAGAEAGASTASKVQSSAFGAIASGEAQAGAEAKVGFKQTTKIGSQIEAHNTGELAAKAQAKAEGTAFADKHMLAAGASGSAEGSVQVKAEARQGVTLGGSIDVTQKGTADAKAQIKAEGSAQASLMGAKAEGSVKVGAQAEAKAENRVAIKELGGAGIYGGGAAKAQADAGAKAGARLGLLEGVGGSAKAEAAARAEAGAHQGLDYGVGSATAATKVFAQAKAEAKASAEISWNPADKVGAKFGVGAMASAGVGVSIEHKLADKGGHSAGATATLMSPGAAGAKIDLDCSLKDGELKFKIGGALGIGICGVKLDGEINLNLKPQKQAIENAIHELKAITPESALKNPDTLAPAVTKAADKAAEALIKSGQTQGGLAGKITEASGHVLKAVNDNITKPIIKPIIEAAKPVIKVVEAVVPKPIVKAATAAWNWFTGLFRR
ncbi:hypothetical protein [Microvirga sp. 2TAF3]|uniref:hypothetical protein n=1 Tax=Microvirga sp. 2TAF3 TaxID=3233014 RepID=UPI003F9A7EEA